MKREEEGLFFNEWQPLNVGKINEVELSSMWYD